MKKHQGLKKKRFECTCRSSSYYLALVNLDSNGNLKEHIDWPACDKYKKSEERVESSWQEKALKMLQQYKSDAEIARELNKYIKTIKKWREDNGLISGREQRREDCKPIITQMRANGVIWREIAKECNISEAALSYWAKDWGLR